VRQYDRSSLLSPYSAANSPTQAPSAAAPEAKRSRGRGETVALTVRVSRADWTRLHQLALSEGVSLQTLAMRGFSRELEAHGLAGMAT
jgi:hypothetical protein